MAKIEPTSSNMGAAYHQNNHCRNIYCLLLSLVVAAQFAVARVTIHHSDATEIGLSNTRQGGLTVQAAELNQPECSKQPN